MSCVWPVNTLLHLIPPNVENNSDNGSHAAMMGIELAEKHRKIDNDTKAKQFKF